MSKFQPSRSQVPVDERSVLATVPGLPWWGAVITLLAFTAVGALVAGEYTGMNAGVLAMAAGAIVAVLAVRNRALFTAMVQPPLVIATAIPVYKWFTMPSPRKTSAILTDVLFPMISLFPWMFWITVVVLAIGGARLVLYRRLTATARSAQRSSAGAKQTAKAGAAAKSGAGSTPGSGKKTPASAGLPIGERIRAAVARMRPAPAAAASSAGAAALVGSAGTSERHQSGSRRTSSSTADRGPRRDRSDAQTAGAPGSRPAGRSSAARSSAARAEEPRRRLTREEVARRDEGAPATRVNRVVRPDSGQIRRNQPPRRTVDDERRDVPRSARPRPAVAQGDRPRPVQHDSRELRRDADRRGIEQPPRWRGARDPELRPDAPSGPRRAVPRPDSRDYRREARDIDRARGGDAPRPRPERERSRIPRDDFGSLPRISGTRAVQPDLPSLPRDPERPSRRTESPATPGRYEHYRAPRYRPQSEETPVETNFRDDFAEPAEPRPIRRHRYKD